MRGTLQAVATLGLILAAFGCSPVESADGPPQQSTPLEGPFETATLAGDCFWCIESAFDDVDGVAEAISGYTGGEIVDPTYSQVSAGRTKHLEAVQVRFDPEVIDYEALLGIFWRQIDPTDDGGQFADRGNQYRTAIFVDGDGQRAIAEKTRAEIAADGRFEGKIVTRILDAMPFYPAEEYHQDYHRKHPVEYKRYRYGSGRTPFLEKTWSDSPARSVKLPADADLRDRLTPIQYYVTQQDGTERSFQNEYWDHQGVGIYVDIVSGEPLFSSTHKFKSGTGWPSFTQPLSSDALVERPDNGLIGTRTEVRSRKADSHLGHVFPDGPEPTGLRYCINSASLRFVPVEQLESEGLEQFRSLFDQ